jgi:hypothetical protein
VICGYRVEEIEHKLMQQIRYPWSRIRVDWFRVDREFQHEKDLAG